MILAPATHAGHFIFYFFLAPAAHVGLVKRARVRSREFGAVPSAVEPRVRLKQRAVHFLLLGRVIDVAKCPR